MHRANGERILIAGLLYQPEICPVEYGGTLVSRVSLHLEDGRYLEHSSLECGAQWDPQEGLDWALNRLEEDCNRILTESGVAPGLGYRWQPPKRAAL